MSTGTIRPIRFVYPIANAFCLAANLAFPADKTVVLDPVSRPLPGVLVRRLEMNQLQVPPSDDQWTTIGTTGADGRFAADPSTSKSLVVLSKPGFAVASLVGHKPLDSSVTMAEGAAITGAVSNEKGEPIPGALIGPVHPMIAVADRTMDAPPVSEAGAPLWTKTDAYGRFRVEGLTQGMHGFLVQADGFAPHMVARPTGVETTITVSSAGTTWSGVLLGSRDRQPQPGIYVEAVSGLLRVYAKSGDDGRFQFPLLQGDDWQFRTAASPVSSPKGALLARRKRTTKGNDVVVLHNQGVAVSGQLIDARTKSPVANVGLQLEAFQGEDALTTRSDDHGRFVFENADAFRSLTLRFEEYVCRTPQNTYWSEVAVDTMKAEDQTTLSFALLSRVAVRGRLVGPGKRPVPDANISFKLRGTGEPGFGDFVGRVKYEAKSKAGGDFEAVLFPQGQYDVEATVSTLASGRINFDASTSTVKELVIDMKPLMSVRGRTLDATGGPLAECRLDMTTSADATETTATAGRLLHSVRSDMQGRFNFEGIFPERVTVTAAHPSSDDTVTTEVASSGAPSTGIIELQFPPGQLFAAHVTDDQSAPIAGATVQVYADQRPDAESSGTKMLTRRTDAEGRAVFALHARRLHKVVVRKQDFAPYSAGPVVLPQSSYEIHLNPNPSIAVTITGQSATAPGEKRQVWLLRADKDAEIDPLSSFFQSMRREESTEGTARFKNVLPGLYKVSTSNGTLYGESEPVEVNSDSGIVPVTLSLAQGSTISGRVTDEETGDPVKDAQVAVQLPCCTPQGFEADPVPTDGDGKFEFAGLPAGAMLMTVKHKNYSERAMHVLAPHSGTKSVDVKLGHGTCVLAGRVTLDGKPLPSTAIYIYRAANRNEYAESAVTDDNGKYAVEGVPEGNHVLQAQALWGADQVDLRRSQEIRVKGRTTKVDIDFRALVHVTGHVRMDASEEGPNPRNTLFFAQRSAGEDLGQSFREAKLSSDGNFEIYLEPGAYTVGLQEGAGASLDVPDGTREFVVNYELRDLAEASGLKLAAPGAPVEPKDVPDKEGL